ncbi:MAG: nuclear transport factor 2 family protein [Gemmatimonadaceae bacterium]|nr:nuclear transport factor 2 family protein [Gemmatimonadaceae bacterium]NUS47722.1 nuclear transport factor 2 family protein [Gemmatimonadaceae bacterium]
MRPAVTGVAAALAATALILTAALVPAVAASKSATLVAVTMASDSAFVAATVDRFHAALVAGDSATVLAMLAPDAIVLESGDVETRAEYRSHHLPADIEYARAISGTHRLVSVVVHGDAAWASSTSISQGRMKDRPINSAGAELMVLSRQARKSPWQIRALHWSSHRRTS